MSRQKCPNCLQTVDVGIYVSGRRIRCPHCRIPFVVTREELLAGTSTARDPGAPRLPPPRTPTPGQPRPQPLGEPRAPTPAVSPRSLHLDAETTPSRPVRALKPDGSPVTLDDSPADSPAHPAAKVPGNGTPASPPIAEPSGPSLADAPDFPGYRLVAVVGQGAMGTVYRAVRLDDQRTVALKVLSEKLAENSEFIARFEREVAAINAVDHPYVVHLLDHGSVNDHHYFAMEFVEGPSLRTEFSVTHPIPARVVELLCMVTEGLLAAHDAGVVHRDLKPENVVVTPEGGVSIVDFGLAGLFGDGDPHPNLTRSRVTMGTVNYMAPEQRTNAKYVDQRADIYAIGVMLYEGLTGELPVGRFQYPCERGMPLPAFVDVILSRTLSKEREDRYDTCRALLVDLRKLRSVMSSAAMADTALPRQPGAVREQVAARRQSIPGIQLKTAVRRRLGVGLVALGVVAAIALVVWWRAGSGGAVEVVVEGETARRVSAAESMEGPGLGLVATERAAFDTLLGEWTGGDDSLVHRCMGRAAHLQPAFARAVLVPPLAASDQLRLRVALDLDPVSAAARQRARAEGFVEEARPDLPIRVGLGFEQGGLIVGGYVDAAGGCGYFRSHGNAVQVWEHRCGDRGAQAAVLELRRDQDELLLRVDALELPPQQVEGAAAAERAAVVCQNARCQFAAAQVDVAERGPSH